MVCQDRLGTDMRKRLEREGRFWFRTVERRGGHDALVARPAVGEINGRIVPELRKTPFALSCPYVYHEPVWVNQLEIGQLSMNKGRFQAGTPSCSRPRLQMSSGPHRRSKSQGWSRSHVLEASCRTCRAHCATCQCDGSHLHTAIDVSGGLGLAETMSRGCMQCRGGRLGWTPARPVGYSHSLSASGAWAGRCTLC
jgi:hypothetical protein